MWQGDKFNSSIAYSMPEILFSFSCVLLVMLTSLAPVHLPRFSITRIPSFVFSSLLLFSSLGLEKFPLSIFFLDFLLGVGGYVQFGDVRQP